MRWTDPLGLAANPACVIDPFGPECVTVTEGGPAGGRGGAIGGNPADATSVVRLCAAMLGAVASLFSSEVCGQSAGGAGTESFYDCLQDCGGAYSEALQACVQLHGVDVGATGIMPDERELGRCAAIAAAEFHDCRRRCESKHDIADDGSCRD